MGLTEAESLPVLPDGWQCIRLIERGAFAAVYEGRAPDGQRVAIKIPDSEHPQTLPRFLREVKVMQAMPDNPHVVRFRATGALPEGTPWLAMEFVDGYTLDELFESGARLSEAAACELMLQLCESLGGLHGLGLSHGDIKPKNVMLTHENLQVKLLDFGLVRDAQGLFKLMEQEHLLPGSEFSDDLDTGLLMGTPEYLAPEAIADARVQQEHEVRRDARADIFALGVIAYELLVGRRLWPFEPNAENRKDYIQQCVTYLDARTKIDPADLPRPDEIAAPLWSVIERALATDPGRRHADAMSLHRDLRAYVEFGACTSQPNLDNPALADLTLSGTLRPINRGDRSPPSPLPSEPEPLPLVFLAGLGLVGAMALIVFTMF